MKSEFPVHDLSPTIVLQRYQPNASIRAYALRYGSVVESLRGLIGIGEFESSVDFLAHALLPQQGVWWGCLCVWHANRLDHSDKLDVALSLLLAWLQSPEEATRQPLLQIDQWFSSKQPIGLLAKGAYFSGPSMAPPKLPAVPPPPFLFSQMVSATVQLVVAKLPVAQREFNYKQMLRLGMEVLHGVNHWSQPTP